MTESSNEPAFSSPSSESEFRHAVQQAAGSIAEQLPADDVCLVYVRHSEGIKHVHAISAARGQTADAVDVHDLWLFWCVLNDHLAGALPDDSACKKICIAVQSVLDGKGTA